MKKIISILLCMTLIFTAFDTTVYAENEDSQDIQEITWEEAREQLQEDEIEGDFVNLMGTGLKMWMPDFLKESELEYEDLEDGFIAVYGDEKAEKGAYVWYSDTDAEDLDEYMEELEDYDWSDGPTKFMLNGRECLVYLDEEEDSGWVSLEDENGNLVDFFFSPISDNDFASIAECMISSIQPAARDYLLENEAAAFDDSFELNWEDAEEWIKKYEMEGEFISLDKVAVKAWIPDGYERAELYSREMEEGAFETFEAADGSFFTFAYKDAEETDLETLYKDLEKDKNISDLDIIGINGNIGVIYTEENEDTSTIVFETVNGGFFTLTMSPVSDEDFQITATMVFGSLQSENDRLKDRNPKGMIAEPIFWEDAEDYIETNKLKGGFITFDDIDIQMWIHDDTKAASSEKSWEKDGIIAKYETADGGVVTVTYKDGEGKSLFADYQEELEKNKDLEYFEAVSINGYGALSYSQNDETGYIVFETEKGYILTFVFEGIDDEDFLTTAQIMIFSIMPAEEAADAEDAQSEKTNN